MAAAEALLGALLVREPVSGDGGRRVGRIVEVEAYGGADDRASHARMGPTSRNAVMFGPSGRAYVYLVYGMHHCLNVVAGADGAAAAVLIRAVEPIEGADAMRVARSAARPPRSLTTTPDARLAAGPALVAACFSVDRAMNAIDLCDPASPLHLAAATADSGPDADLALRLQAGARIGIAYAGEPWASFPWRLAISDSPSLSRRID